MLGTLLLLAGIALVASRLGGVSVSGALRARTLRRMRERRQGLYARWRGNWDRRMDELLRRAGRPRGMSARRLTRLAALLAGTGAILAFLTLLADGGAERALVFLLLGALGGYHAPQILCRILTLRARSVEVQESIQLLQTLEVYLQHGHTLRAALEVSAEALPFLGARIRHALAVWGQGPYRAIDQLVGETSDPSAGLVIAALKQAVDLGPGQLPIFLQREQEAIQKSREALQKAAQSRRPVMFTMYLGVPIVGYVVALLIPLAMTMTAQIAHIGGVF